MDSMPLLGMIIVTMLVVLLLLGSQRLYKPITEETIVSCLLVTDAVDTEFIINSQEEMQVLQQYKHDYGRCANRTLPQLDFLAFTLLGKVVSVDGCQVTVNHKVTWDEERKEVIYYIMPKSEGVCAMKTILPNWILVEKIPDDYTVRFVVEQQ